MYLSRVAINPARRGARRLLASPQAMHAAVLAGFYGPRSGGSAHDMGGRVLWRLDAYPHRTCLYVVSPDEPDFTHLGEQAGWPSTQAWERRRYEPLLDTLAAGQRWGFRATANPTRSTRLSEDRRSQRVGHVTEVQQRRWFAERAAGWGFDLAPVAGSADGEPAGQPLDTSSGDELDRRPVQVRERQVLTFPRAGRRVTLTRVTYQGVLTVVDARLLRASLVNGVGPAKAYGCGLLTLAPLTGPA